jgi:hypothetical protein
LRYVESPFASKGVVRAPIRPIQTDPDTQPPVFLQPLDAIRVKESAMREDMIQ